MINAKPKALISVTDKTGLIPLAQAICDGGWDILSTGGTAILLREAGVAITDVAAYTGSPEIMGGRVKTLHPKIHGGILMDRSQPDHVQQAQNAGMAAIDIVVANLYDFTGQAVESGLPLAQASEYIDIGGEAMLRAAAKNARYVAAICDPDDYGMLIPQIQQGSIDLATRRHLASKTFQVMARYNQAIADYLNPSQDGHMTLNLCRFRKLRYGENPHQSAGFYGVSGQKGLQDAEVLQGKELSYNNYLDLNSAAKLIADLSPLPATVIVKHTNPCGVACGAEVPIRDLFARALLGDAKSAFGGIVATNQRVDEATALSMTEIFLECIIAPSFAPQALGILAGKTNLRLLAFPPLAQQSCDQTQHISPIWGGYLIQDHDNQRPDPSQWRSVAPTSPTPQQERDLCFAQIVCKHVKSNAIVLAKDGRTLGIGAGQMSRVDALWLAIHKAKEMGHDLQGAVLASDAFFPFRDTVDLAAQHGVTAIIQPGGSKRDQESIDACDQQGVAMVFTGVRHFRHSSC